MVKKRERVTKDEKSRADNAKPCRFRFMRTRRSLGECVLSSAVRDGFEQFESFTTAHALMSVFINTPSLCTCSQLHETAQVVDEREQFRLIMRGSTRGRDVAVGCGSGVVSPGVVGGLPSSCCTDPRTLGPASHQPCTAILLASNTALGCAFVR